MFSLPDSSDYVSLINHDMAQICIINDIITRRTAAYYIMGKFVLSSVR